MGLDQAGWHGANDLQVPSNLTLAPSLPNSPELNWVERLWRHLREQHLSRRLLDDDDAIVEACCDARNELTVERVHSLCNYPYIQQVNE